MHMSIGYLFFFSLLPNDLQSARDVRGLETLSVCILLFHRKEIVCIGSFDPGVSLYYLMYYPLTDDKYLPTKCTCPYTM